jgi:Protein of unknown function (DUF669)
MATINFDQSKVPEGTSFAPLPAGRYQVEIIESDVRATKAGNGHYLHLTFRVVEGPHEGRQLFDRINFDNPSQQTVEIAQKTLRKLCRLCGYRPAVLENTEELHFKRFHINVGIETTPGYDAQNTVRYPEVQVEGAPVLPLQQSPKPPQEPARPAAPTAEAPKPWQRKARF